MSFLKEHGTAAILLAVIFMSLGFMMGRCCSHKGGCHKPAKCHKGEHKCGHHEHGDHAVFISDDGHSEEMIIVKALMEEGFEGDTTMSIPGGEIVLSIGEDGEVDVEVDIDNINEAHGEHIHEVHKEVKIIKTTEEH